jgi:Transglutaminase-like superfamily
MRGRLAAWRALNGTDQRRLLGLACGLPLVELSLRCLGARRTASWLSRAIKPRAIHPTAAAELQQADRLAHLAAIAGRRGILEARCLSQALLVRAVLRRRGLDAVLQVGVRKDSGQFDAHAWVELDGHTLAQVALQHLPLQPPPGTGDSSTCIQPRQPLSALAGKLTPHELGGREHQVAQVARLASDSGQRPIVHP